MESKKPVKEPKLFERLYDLWLPLCSVILCFLLEILSRRSIMGAVDFVTGNPVAFVFGCLIIYATSRLSAFFPHRRLVTVFIWLVWLGLGITAMVVPLYRAMPFSAMDIALLPAIWSIFQNYLSVFVMVLIFIGLALCLTALVFAAIKSVAMRVDFSKALILFVCSLVAAAAVCFAGFGTDALEPKLEDLNTGYEKYGFVYTFGCSIFDRGISEPDNYSEETIDQIADLLDDKPMPLAGDVHAANIVFLQLESFFDPDYVKGVVLNQNPLPNFTRLRSQCSGGFLRVPVMGAGTVNTEFEVITGMNIDYFGVSEYPYETILQANTCESICFDLRTYGYTNHAVHDNDASFYKRNTVYSMLGFDTFTPLEYITDVEYNPIGWADDSCLTKCILDAFESTSGPDMVFTVSVQPHGKYPTEYDETWKRSIQVSGVAEDDVPAWEYYVDQLRQEDEFIGEVIRALETCGEDTVLVVYGDHLPNLGLEAADMEYGSIFRTEYAIWSNFPMQTVKRDLDAYQLSAYVQSLLGMSSGELTVLHQELSRSEDYQKFLEDIEYDILYGEKIIYDGKNPYEPTLLQFGAKKIAISSVENTEGWLYTVHGEGFTPYSRVMVNGIDRETEYLDSQTLTFLHSGGLTSNDTLIITQYSESDDELGRGEPFVPNL